MDIQVLRWFQAVAAGATVTETAELSHISQPALSRALAKIDREVGTPLMYRSGRLLRLTPAGQIFKTHVDQVLDRYDDGLRAVAQSVDPDSGLVPLSFLHTFGTWMVPTLLHGFRRTYPRIRFELKQHGEEGIMQELVDGVVDLALTSDDPGHPLVTWRHLLTEPLLLALPPHHRLAGRRRVRLRDVAAEPFVVLQTGFGLRATTEKLCEAAGFEPVIAFEGEEVETLRGLVTAGLGVSLLPLQQTATYPPTVVPPASPHLPVTDVNCYRDVGLAWLTERPLPPASAAFSRHVLKTAPGLLAG
jgi:DNA-binding transcriptional LysR family regulator